MKEEALKYVAGYVAYRFKDKYPLLNLGCYTKDMSTAEDPDWIQFISKGHLLYPSDDLLRITKISLSEFNRIHGTFLSGEPMIFRKIADQVIIQSPDIGSKFSYEVLLCISRTLTYISL